MSFDLVGVAWFVLDTSLRALAAAALVAALLWALRIRAAAVRHAAWTAVLVVMFLLPGLSFIVPPVTVRWPATATRLIEAVPGVEQPSLVQSNQAPGASSAFPSTGIVGSAQLTDLPEPSATSAHAPRSWLSSLPSLLLGLYAAGVVVLAVRLFYGWSLAVAMIRRAKRNGPVDIPQGQVYQSPEVAVPMTVGAFRPAIVLPEAWRTWAPDTLAAIVAHEGAHVRRRDASINLVAHLNRAIFWFHPLAWWLERTLAITAEHACDEAAARAIAAPGRYAGVLVEMADIVRRNRGRLTWQAVGVNGAGVLEDRIERVLRGDMFARTSRGKKVAVWTGCAVALAAVVACRQDTSAVPLRADPALAQRLAGDDASRKQFEAARDMTQAQADMLEQRLVVNPEDVEARRQLVTYYTASGTVAWNTKVAGLRRHALWLIAHHPEGEVEAPVLSPQADPEGFAAAKALWQGYLARPDVSPFLVYRAAMFFAPHDKPYAEQLIRRGLAMDPGSAALKARTPPGAGAYEWPMQLADVYAAALRGSDRLSGAPHLDRMHTPYATQLRRTLESTTDAQLLARVGDMLVRPNPPIADPAITQALDEVHALGVHYLQRALERDPTLRNARVALVRAGLPGQSTDIDRLAIRALDGYMRAEDITEYARKDPASAKRQRDEAAAQAEEVLTIAARHDGDPAYSAAVMTAHQVLATAALRNGDRARAVDHLRRSVQVPTSDQVKYAPPASWLRPVNRLLEAGEREQVAEFLDAFARLTLTERARLRRDATTIREGRMPPSYQYMVFTWRRATPAYQPQAPIPVPGRYGARHTDRRE